MPKSIVLKSVHKSPGETYNEYMSIWVYDIWVCECMSVWVYELNIWISDIRGSSNSRLVLNIVNASLWLKRPSSSQSSISKQTNTQKMLSAYIHTYIHYIHTSYICSYSHTLIHSHMLHKLHWTRSLKLPFATNPQAVRKSDTHTYTYIHTYIHKHTNRQTYKYLCVPRRQMTSG